MKRYRRRLRSVATRACALLLLVACPSASLAIDVLDPSTGTVLSHVDVQYNSSSWAAANLTDDDVDSLWLSSQPTNDLLYRLLSSSAPACFDGLTLQNYGSSRSIRSFTLLSTNDAELTTDTGTDGWVPIPADLAPTGLINHLHWSQGARLTSVDGEYNSTTWAGSHLNDGSLRSQWLNNKNENTLEYEFDTDWDGSTGDEVNLDAIRLHNYGSSRSVSRFQIQVTQDGTSWSRLAVPGTDAGDPDFNFVLESEGGSLARVQSQYDSNTWAGRHLHDGDYNSIWLSRFANNELDFEFDTDFDGMTGMSGDPDDLFEIERIHLRNYGSARSVRLFQIEVRTQASGDWIKLEVPGSRSGEPDFNFLLDWEGANLTRVDKQYNSSSYAAKNLHDGDTNTLWLSNRSNNELDFQFDVNGDDVDGMAGDNRDHFRIDQFKLFNYGSARSVRLFQVEVKTQSKPDWTPIEVPGSGAGDANFNFALSHEGASLTNVDSEYNSTSYAARNLHDGDHGNRWLSGKPNNELDFAFDTDGDGATGDAINFYTVRLYNYGNSRSIQTFEIDVRTGGPTWSPVTAPGGGTIFNASQAATAQDFSVGPIVGVTAVRLRTLSNHGDTYTGANEFELLGDSVRASHTFTAQQSSTGESFVLDPLDRAHEVTSVRFRSISNYGDSYTGAREFEILGPSLGPSHTFEAAQTSAGEDFILDLSDRPANVKAVRFRSIRNYGDSYTGMRELALYGTAPRPSYTFEPGQAVGPHLFTLDPEDRVEGVVGARFHSLNNYGDSYVGAKELELLGDPVGPSFVFEAGQASTPQSFAFDPTDARIFRFRALDNFGDSYVGAREIDLGSASGCPGATDRFLIGHDGSGVQCSPETLSVTAIGATGSPDSSYTGTIVLTTQTGTGDWGSEASNEGIFSDTTSGDGLATYTFAASDLGTARFSVSNLAGVESVDIDVYQSGDVSFRDDDSEGALLLLPSGFTLTASALPNPPPDPINDPILNQTAGASFSLHLTAFGTSPSDPDCGVIESYAGDKPVRFWIDHGDPGTGPLVPIIDARPTARSEGGSTSQTVRFDQGQAVVSARYKDVGRITIHALDDSGPTLVSGSTGSFVSRPADLVVVGVENAAGDPNPGASTPTGDLFARAGEPMTVQVEAQDAQGDRTPSYGRESVPEGIRIRSSTLVAPSGGRNGILDDGAIANADAFSATTPDGTFVGSSFAFAEVGAIRLTASVADGDYLGTGDVTGSESSVVGRFAPSDFEVTANTPRFRTACGLGAFSWIGQPFGFVTGEEGRLTVRARNAGGDTTTNYAGDWWRITNGSLANRSYSIGGATLVESGLPNTNVDPVIVSKDDGTGTLTFSTGTGLAVERTSPIAPFEGEIQLAIDVIDEDDTIYFGNPFTIGGTSLGTGIAFDVSKRFQFGRLRFDNAHGSELVDLPMSLRTQSFDGSVFVDDGNDSCSQISEAVLALTPSPAALASTPTIGNQPLLGGQSALVLGAPGDDGTLDITVDLGPGGADLPWLRYDWPEDGNLDGLFDDDPRARATFGIWEGREQLIFVREVY